jgi:hypothetical protein
MDKKTCAIVSVIIGREFSLMPLIDYFKNVYIPESLNVSLYLVLGCDDGFELILKDEINNHKLHDKYKDIYFIEGNYKCYDSLNWDEWEEYTRKIDPDVKHRSALENINKALECAKKEDYIHFVDDDTIPPYNALKELLVTLNKKQKCGLASGVYFNKTWVEPTIAVSFEEAKRRVVASVEKKTWQGCSVDVLSISDYTDIGFVGNGCMLVNGDDIKKILPLTEYRHQGDDIAPPDFIICRRMRYLGKVISISPSIVAKHLDQKGVPVGLTPEYINSLKNSNDTKDVLVLNYNDFLDFDKLSKKYHQILLIVHKEVYYDYDKSVHNYSNIEIINRSIVETCEKYDDYKNYKDYNGMSQSYSILEEIHKYINKEVNYVVYTYSKELNLIHRLPFLDSRNLKEFLNKENG